MREKILLPMKALDIPKTLLPLLSQLTAVHRRELVSNPFNHSPSRLTASIQHLDVVDVDNTISTGVPRPSGGDIRVAELNAERGRFWCEFAAQIKRTPDLKAVDIWLLNEFDLGMARTKQQHTVRLLAHALGLNYAWAVEFIELTNGNEKEQLRTVGVENQFGLHGNAILSRWPLHNARVVRMPGMDRLYTSRGPETARGYEKRLGGRMTLLAETCAGADILVGATHAQTSWSRDAVHTAVSIEKLRVQTGDSTTHPRALIGGDTWNHTCHWIGMQKLTRRPAPKNVVVNGKVKLRRGGGDDYICARNLKLKSLTYFPAVGVATNGTPNGIGKEFPTSDHTFVTARVNCPECREWRCDGLRQ